ncbi:PREDICTED: SIEVE ELEMENT OCCLUSION [Prunus dulcis]|uniref:PREDICTED: SIEVE ELEMENT OCCLUSION n=1 Tax=Prunus dulcis TaxID=3755 RepID=A0A5E4G0G4_PRUDU|nr:PREDICTED: SIEVE ELEMENT OCCLUSION [Prunus dulcis]
MAQLMGCSRNLFARFNAACRVGRFNSSRPATTSYPNNEGIIPSMTSAAMSRRGFQGSRTLADLQKDPIGPLKTFQDLTGSDYKKHFQLTDGSKNHKQVELCMLRWKNLFLFFSSLDTCDREHLSILESVNAEVSKTKDYKIVWIPVVEKWNEKEEKDFYRLRSQMPWYTAKCSCLHISDMKNKWDYEGKPILVVMDSDGQVKNRNALRMFGEKGITAFPFYAARN